MTALGWHPQDILTAIKKQKWTHQRIANHLKVSRSTVTLALKTGSSAKVRTFVSDLLGVPEEELWAFRFPSILDRKP
jgi:lambda repressor-like predicted transcriptional regulator